MSKYLMNKLIHLVNMNESAEDEYTANPRAFVEKWEKTQKLKLEPEEREALATKDYGKLYALGAHPFTLWSFTEAVCAHEKPREELVADYKAQAVKAGYPNFKT
jgi:Aromatic-ring-opening dioxygenase LigAB, LigA subunit